MINTQEWRKCEWIKFHDNRTNHQTTTDGLQVGKYLAVCGGSAKGFRIFQVLGGRLISNIRIETVEDAVRIAQYIDQQYAEFLGVWEVYPDWDVIGIARLGVPRGEAIYNALNDLEKSIKYITYNDFMKKLNE